MRKAWKPLLLLAGLFPVAGCCLGVCKHPHHHVTEELTDRSLTSKIAYCPSIDLNWICPQPWFQPSSCLADDRRQRALLRESASFVPPPGHFEADRLQNETTEPEPNPIPPAPVSSRPEKIPVYPLPRRN